MSLESFLLGETTFMADRQAISTKTLHNMLQRWGLLGRTAPARADPTPPGASPH